MPCSAWRSDCLYKRRKLTNKNSGKRRDFRLFPGAALSLWSLRPLLQPTFAVQTTRHVTLIRRNDGVLGVLQLLSGFQRPGQSHRSQPDWESQRTGCNPGQGLQVSLSTSSLSNENLPEYWKLKNSLSLSFASNTALNVVSVIKTILSSSLVWMISFLFSHFRLCFRCEFCDLCSSQSKSINKHRRIHKSQDRPYQCTTCNISFPSFTLCTTHKSSHHGEDLLVPQPGDFTIPKHFICGECCKYTRVNLARLFRLSWSHLKRALYSSVKWVWKVELRYDFLWTDVTFLLCFSSF